MFDNLRDLSDSPLYEDDQDQDDLFKDMEEIAPPVATPVRKRRKSKTFLGMTAPQRFLLSVMLMFTACLFGTLVMFVLGKMAIF